LNDFTYWKELPKLEKVLEDLFLCYRHDQYEYPDKIDKEKKFSSVTRNHFKGKYQDLADRLYGVYIISRLKPKEILYIGKAGTFDKDGYKPQNLPGRLCNKVSKKITRNAWMRNLYERHSTLLLIQFILFPDFKKDPTPTFIESLLIQSYLKEKKELPLENKGF